MIELRVKINNLSLACHALSIGMHAEATKSQPKNRLSVNESIRDQSTQNQKLP